MLVLGMWVSVSIYSYKIGVKDIGIYLNEIIYFMSENIEIFV